MAVFEELEDPVLARVLPRHDPGPGDRAERREDRVQRPRRPGLHQPGQRRQVAPIGQRLEDVPRRPVEAQHENLHDPSTLSPRREARRIQPDSSAPPADAALTDHASYPIARHDTTATSASMRSRGKHRPTFYRPRSGGSCDVIPRAPATIHRYRLAANRAAIPPIRLAGRTVGRWSLRTASVADVRSTNCGSLGSRGPPPRHRPRGDTARAGEFPLPSADSYHWRVVTVDRAGPATGSVPRRLHRRGLAAAVPTARGGDAGLLDRSRWATSSCPTASSWPP